MKHLVLIASLFCLCVLGQAQNCEPLTLSQLENITSVDTADAEKAILNLNFKLVTKASREIVIAGITDTIIDKSFEKCVSPDRRKIQKMLTTDGIWRIVIIYTTFNSNEYSSIKAEAIKKSKYHTIEKVFYNSDYVYSFNTETDKTTGLTMYKIQVSSYLPVK